MALVTGAVGYCSAPLGEPFDGVMLHTLFGAGLVAAGAKLL